MNINNQRLLTSSPKAVITSLTTPVLAILTIDDQKRAFLGNRSNFIDIIRTGNSMGFIVYVLTIKKLLLNRTHLQGYVYLEETGKWQQELLPFPDVIYNRIPQREHERLPLVRAKLKACRRHPKLSMFNPNYFNKWHLFKWLRESRKTLRHIPATRRLNSVDNLKLMLAEHDHLYLKPVSGKAGQGIMTVTYIAKKSLPYRLQIQQNKRSSTYHCSTLAKLWIRIQQQRTKEPYIVQQAIKLAAYHDRKYDLRALVQKNRHGHWELSGLGARVAGAYSITTHVPRGGKIEEPEKLLRFTFNEQRSGEILNNARNITTVIARQIEKGSKQTLGEMSMDLGVDTDGKLWVFEANAKPMKFDEPHIRQKSLERIFQYAHYLMLKKKNTAEITAYN
ncbi:YheC/YheD family protein [Paenibacillus yanchengensis]|uniref:YheC/YheD family protein n=1 Tax=Paenibacillus yanchengensis TaxID=2035833 RepID=A0ABW4YLJ8_9BACL